MADIFISYKRESREHVEHLSQILEAYGFNVWYDSKLKPGNWDTQIQDQLEAAGVVLAVLCRHASEKSVIFDEIQFAIDRKKKLVLAIVETGLGYRPLQIRRENYIDLTEWDGEPETFSGYPLVRALETLIGDRRLNKQKRRVLSEDWHRSGGLWYGKSASDVVEAPAPLASDLNTSGSQALAAKELAGRVRIDAARYENRHYPLFLPGAGRTEWFQDISFGPRMVVIPAGSMMCGARPEEPGASPREYPAHIVEIARPFALGRAPVTVAQWARYLTSKQIDRPDGEDDGPIVNVSWHDACEYVAWLSAQVRQRYRLPTEAEWEYAARGNQPETLYWWGDDITPDLAHYGRSIGCAPVEQLKANAFGLYDVHGNVAEWVADSYSEYRSGTSNGSALVLDDELELRSVVRGGSWASHPRALRCASRRPRTKTESSPDIGFRVARDIV